LICVVEYPVTQEHPSAASFLQPVSSLSSPQSSSLSPWSPSYSHVSSYSRATSTSHRYETQPPPSVTTVVSSLSVLYTRRRRLLYFLVSSQTFTAALSRCTWGEGSAWDCPIIDWFLWFLLFEGFVSWKFFYFYCWRLQLISWLDWRDLFRTCRTACSLFLYGMGRVCMWIGWRWWFVLVHQ